MPPFLGFARVIKFLGSYVNYAMISIMMKAVALITSMTRPSIVSLQYKPS